MLHHSVVADVDIAETRPHVLLAAGIKAIKLYAWEEPYMERVNQLRYAELRMIRKAAFYGIFNTLMFGGGPILVSLASFSTYTWLGYSLTAGVAFPALALFNLLRFPVRLLGLLLRWEWRAGWILARSGRGSPCTSTVQTVCLQ